MLKRILKKMRSDGGASSLISFLLLAPLFLGAVFTIIDFTFWNADRNQVDSIARDAARTVAIYGGNGNGSTKQTTTIEANYGTKRSEACSSGRADIVNAPQKYIFVNANKSNATGVECNVLAAMANSTGLVSISSDTPVVVNCGPGQAATIGSRTFCKVTYTYNGLPGSPMSFLKIRNSDGTVTNPLSLNTITKSSESEVKLPALVAAK